MVVVDDSSLQADSQPKSGCLVWGSAAAWRCSTVMTWTEWTLTMTLWSWWQHYKYRPGYYCLILLIIGLWYDHSKTYVKLGLLQRGLNKEICQRDYSYQFTSLWP